ncbi:MAG TPA: hypothetical protein VGQ33_20995, partial [Vicinamibacteria bacterium]|nr:hypothetical protein [Vicinamibacteria bacterium]
HGLSGRAGSLDLTLSAPGAPLTLALSHAPDERPFLETPLGESPRSIRLAVASGQRDVDVWLRASSTQGLPLLLHRAVLEQEAGLGDRLLQVLPLAVGLAVLWILARRLSLGLALAFALAALAAGVLAVQAFHDPSSLLEIKTGARHRAQVALVALVAVAALWGPPSRRLACATLALVGGLLFLPTASHGLVSDDFLWARDWTLRDVASSFVGSEDPTGASNTYYRPLSTISHATDAWIWGDRVAGYHLTNLVLLALLGGVALLLLEALGLSRRAALLGALAWTVHPMAASAVAWASQRTDLIVACFYLSCLAVLLSPLGTRGWPPLLPALLALGSKEIAVSLPAMATLAVWLALPEAERRSRRRALAALWALGTVYVGWWVFLFPDKAAAKVFADAASAPRTSVSGLGRGLVDIYTQVFAPLGYPQWWDRLVPLDPVRVAAVAALAMVALIGWRWTRNVPRQSWAAAGLAAAWPALVSMPLFGLGLVDVYRLGLLPCFGFAIAAAAAGHALEKRDRRLPAVAALAVVLWLGPLALDAADAWGPGGFYYEMSLSLTRRGEDWLAVFAPRGRARFWAEYGAREHLLDAWRRIDPERRGE